MIKLPLPSGIHNEIVLQTDKVQSNTIQGISKSLKLSLFLAQVEPTITDSDNT